MKTFVVHVRLNTDTVDICSYYMTVMCEGKREAEDIATCYFRGLGYDKIHISYVFEMNSNMFSISPNAPRKFLPNFKKEFEKNFRYT